MSAKKQLHEKFGKYGYRTNYGVRRLTVFFWFQQAKTRARRKGMEFDLVMSEIEIPDVCPVLGIPLLFGPIDPTTCQPPDGTPSFDRIDNTKGYTKDNVRIISLLANKLKSSMTKETIEALYRYVCQ